MGAYLIRRSIATMIVLWLSTLMVFGILRLVPGDPARAILGQQATPEAVEALRHQLGLDRPLLEQYAAWLSGIVRGQLGRSLATGESVGFLLWSRVPATLPLAIGSLLIAVAVGLPSGMLAAIRRGSWTDAIVSLVALAGLSIPHFWLGILLILWLSLGLRWFPPGGFVDLFHDPVEGLRRLVLPCFTLGFSLAAYIARLTRSAMLEVLQLDYVRTARAKGVPQAVIIAHHALRNALIPVLTAAAFQLGYILGGAVVVESVFTWPGIGRLSVTAVYQRDFTVIQGVALLMAVLYIVINFAVDVAYALIDPRIRYT